MKVYTYSEARQRLSTLLEEALRDGSVGIRRKGRPLFVIRPERAQGSPLDVRGVDLDITTDEIVGLIRESRRGM
jgi:prevent-host-death family protein